jgi:hypothetical protein
MTAGCSLYEEACRHVGATKQPRKSGSPSSFAEAAEDRPPAPRQRGLAMTGRFPGLIAHDQEIARKRASYRLQAVIVKSP